MATSAELRGVTRRWQVLIGRMVSMGGMAAEFVSRWHQRCCVITRSPAAAFGCASCSGSPDIEGGGGGVLLHPFSEFKWKDQAALRWYLLGHIPITSVQDLQSRECQQDVSEKCLGQAGWYSLSKTWPVRSGHWSE